MAWELDELETVVGMALMGAGIDAIGVETKKRQAELRGLTKVLGIPLERLEYPPLCPRCANTYLIGDRGMCAKCYLADKVIEWEKEEAEEIRLLKEVDRLNSMHKTRRKRRREKAGTNPRKGPNAELLRVLKRDGLPAMVDLDEFGEMEEEEFDPD